MKYSLIILTLSFLFISTFTNADCVAPTSCDDVKVENLYITSHGDIYVETPGNDSALNCTATSNGAYLTLKTDLQTNKNYKEIYSALLAARTTNQPMKINIHSGSAECAIERVEYGRYFN